MKIILLGSGGQLGKCLTDQLRNTSHSVVYISRSQLDITDFNATKIIIANFLPDIIINASAYTAVDKSEEEEEIADLTNHLAVKNIAEICFELDCNLIHISTDYVFDGYSKIPYTENIKTNPQGVYGKTKLRGEEAVKASKCKFIIIRTAWIFSEYGNNFLKTMMNLAKNNNELNIVGDQVGCPTYAQDIAKAIVEILIPSNLEKITSGIFHYCGDQSCSWYEFAETIFKEARSLNMKTPANINAIKTLDYPTLATRPVYSILDCTQIENIFGIKPSDWKLGIKSALRKLN